MARYRRRVAPRNKATGSVTNVDVEGRRLRLSNLEKVLYPARGFTKGEVVDYYARVGPTMLPHLARRPATMVRLPDGVGGERFFEKRCPNHRPDWMETVPLDADSAIQACCIDELPSLVWTANLAALELQLAAEDIDELDRVSAPRFNFPTAFLPNATAQSYAGLTVNGVKFGPSPR